MSTTIQLQRELARLTKIRKAAWSVYIGAGKELKTVQGLLVRMKALETEKPLSRRDQLNQWLQNKAAARSKPVAASSSRDPFVTVREATKTKWAKKRKQAQQGGVTKKHKAV